MARVRTVFFFRGGKYVRYDIDPVIGLETVNLGVYPRDVSEGWKGMPASFMNGFDAVVPWNNGYVYFFKGPKYVRWDATNNTVDAKFYPRDISDEWPAFPATFAAGIDAAINWGDDTVFFFKGSKYIKYVITDDTVDTNIYPRDISDGWSDFPAAFKTGVDAAVNWGNGTAYFFKRTGPPGSPAEGMSYLAYDIGGKAVRPGYPLPVTEPLKWPALVAAGFTGPFDDVLEWPQGDVKSAKLPFNLNTCIKTSQPTVNCGGSFEMEAVFFDDIPSVPACCEYRQFIRGTLEVDGTPVNFVLHERGLITPSVVRPRPQAGSLDDNFREDGLPLSNSQSQNSFGVELFYGHRDAQVGNLNLLDLYVPQPRRSGPQYIGKDLPGLLNAKAGTFVKIDLDFRGQIIDVCNGGVVLRTNEWIVKCSVP